MRKKIRLEELCEKDSSNLKQRDLHEKKDGYPIYGASGLIGYVDFYKQENEYIGIVKDGAGVGRVCILPAKSSVIGTMQYILPKEGVDTHYLYHALVALNLGKYCTGATIPHIYFKDYKSELLPFYSYAEQKKIGREFDEVVALIEKRREQLSEIDNLVKSQFIEMFEGKNFPEMSLDELSFGKGEYGAQSASIPYDKNRPRYVRITDINDDGTLNEDFVSSINTEDDLAYKLSEGDFLFARMGATVGKTYAYKKGNEIFAGYLIRYKLNCQMIVPEYLFWFTKTPTYLTWVKLNQSGAAQPGINAKKYGSLRIPIPPIEEQRRFTRFVEQTDKSKFPCLIQEKMLKKLYFSLINAKTIVKKSQKSYNRRKEAVI